METPVFEEFDPASDCECSGCAVRRRAEAAAVSSPGPARPAARALALAAAAGTVLGAGHSVPAVAVAHAPARPGLPVDDEPPDTPQGEKAPLHGPAGKPERPGAPAVVAVPATTRAEIINRANKWVAAEVPYSMTKYWSDGYRQDCSGFVSMAWNLPRNEWTGSLPTFGVRTTKGALEPGDILLFHNPSNPENGSHVVVFGGWADSTHTYYLAYEQTRPYTRKLSTPYAYWSNSDRYLAYRYKGLAEGAAGEPGPAAPADPGGSDGKSSRFPGAGYFGPGANNAHVTRLGRLLVERGGARFYRTGPGPRWSDADRLATQAFQRAQGWSGAGADGLPGPTTWSYLVGKRGRDIPAGSPGSTTPDPSSHGVPGYPGRALFRPGADNVHVTRLGQQLVRKGFGAHYTKGPGPRWGEADRRNVEAFQRAQGWRGGAADGYPGPETWRRLFS
ncbi:peptidoglycan-binding protein [Streptomyces sp. NPDC005907]|uniref:peptidoglycan-binding protein n=1 Tax=Streptomyces sp. NPDC005907 TaxID=3154571 RepID=UPI0034041D1E